MRTLYSWLIRLGLPFALMVLLWRGYRERLYWQGLRERWGGGAALGEVVCDGFRVWLHAVSLGEMNAAEPLIRALQARYPTCRMLLTTATPAGRALALRRFGDTADVRYLPYDTPGAMRRLLERAAPRAALIMETELWPNLYHACLQQRVPVVIVSARITLRSAQRYAGFGRLFRDIFTTNVTVAAQTAADARRFESLGALPRATHVVGNVKFDLVIDASAVEAGREERAAWGARRVWVAGSTHAGEEDEVLAAHAKLRESDPAALLVLVPRHQDRFDQVAALVAERGFTCVRRSRGERPLAGTQVLLGDTLGELMQLYATGDVAFVGGSLVPIGGHNLLEPAALSRPVLSGPYTENTRDVAALLQSCGALRTVSSAGALAAALHELLGDAAAATRMGDAGVALIRANRGAVQRVLALIEPALAAADRATAR